MILRFAQLCAYLLIAGEAMGCVNISDNSSQTTSTKTMVQLSGFVLMGDAADLKKRYPVTHTLYQQRTARGQSELDLALQNTLTNTPPKFLELSTCGSDSKKNSIAIAVALSHENTSTTKLKDGNYRVAGELSAQLLLIDFGNLKIISAYPLLPFEFIDLLPRAPTSKDIQKMYEAMYFGSEEIQETLFTLAAKRMNTITAETRVTNSLKVTAVDVKPKAIQTLDSLGKETDAVSSWIAQTFSAYLSQNQGVSMLPYSKDHAIGNKMTASFSNGDVYTLTIPEPEYSIRLELKALLSKKLQSSAARTDYANATYHRFLLLEPFDNSTYVDANFRHTLASFMPGDLPFDDKWSVYVESMRKFYKELSIQLGSPSRAWLKKHAGDAKKFSEFKAINKKVLEPSR